jgi:divinyl protochlorophyllide a 8-vinyl-reductase
MGTSAAPVRLAREGHDGPAVPRIGPNAVTQLLVALRRGGRQDLVREACAAAGVRDWMDHPPETMVDEQAVARLHRAVREAVPAETARALMTEAGRLTAEYLLANRIPRAARVLLRLLPPRAAAALLVRAIGAHAWTFAGSGTFSARAGNPTVFTLVNNPLIAGETYDHPLCDWHTAVFDRLFKALVHRGAHAMEAECEAAGGMECRFVVRW